MSYPRASNAYGASMNGKETSMLNITFPQPPEGHCWRITDSYSEDLLQLELLGPPNWRGKRQVVDRTVLNMSTELAGPIQDQVFDRGGRILDEIQGYATARALKAQLIGLTSCEGSAQ